MSAVLNVADVAALLRCSESTVRERAREGKLNGIKFGEDWVFPCEALLLGLNRRAVEDSAARMVPHKAVSTAGGAIELGRRGARRLPYLDPLPAGARP